VSYYRKLESASMLKKIMTTYYRNSKILPYLGKKVAWVTSGAPVELLAGMGIYSLFPENFGAMCGAGRVATDLCRVAEGDSFSCDLCSYARTSIGSILSPSRAPMKGLRKPDIIVCSNNICNTIVKWFESASRYYRVPLLFIDTPFVEHELGTHTLEYVEGQLGEMIAFLEGFMGKKMDDERLALVLNRSTEAVSLWQSILDACRAIPSPLNCPDRFLAMAPIVCLRGTREAQEYYEALHEEISERITRKEGAIVDERVRLLWDNIPVWFDLYGFFNSLAEKGVVFPTDTYTHIWSGVFDKNAPLKSMARVYSSIFLNRGMETRIELIVSMIKKYLLNGFVMHSNRSCKSYSLGQLEIKRRVTERTGIPGIILEGDMCDSRNYDAHATRKRMETYLEILC
jgi:benzoyl-CoA reductase/2-hydroxyglutaryl-CoA dehydratase subunit BcrC/BadD/HgdB